MIDRASKLLRLRKSMSQPERRLLLGLVAALCGVAMTGLLVPHTSGRHAQAPATPLSAAIAGPARSAPHDKAAAPSPGADARPAPSSEPTAASGQPTTLPSAAQTADPPAPVNPASFAQAGFVAPMTPEYLDPRADAGTPRLAGGYGPPSDAPSATAARGRLAKELAAIGKLQARGMESGSSAE